MILVAGGTGRLGGTLVQLLATGGLQVRLLTRHPKGAQTLSTRNAHVVVGDVRDAPSLAPALAGVETVISAVTGFGPGGDGPRPVDFLGNDNLIAAAEAAGAKQFILVSIHRAGPDHPMELNRMKFYAEQRLRKSRLDWTIIRPTVFMELWAGIIGGSGTEKGKTTLFGRGDNPINFVSAGDVARFIHLSLSDPRLRRATLDLGGPENLTMKNVGEIVDRVRGRKAAVRRIPLPAMRIGALLMRPVRPDVARLLQAGVVMATGNMSFDPRDLRTLYPEIPLTRLIDVVRHQDATSNPTLEPAPRGAVD
ncbi:MAG: SDR family oxidoreductase [Candidatus Dormiibacterota bacterium]